MSRSLYTFACNYPCLECDWWGDWSEDRLIPDVIRSINAKTSLEIGSPQATRPWQHVLECLSGYLLLGQVLQEGNREYADAWNFGPSSEDNRTVSNVLSRFEKFWPDFEWHTTEQSYQHEAGQLYLDSSKAQALLGWKSVWSLDEALAATADWYRSYQGKGLVISRSQLAEYISSASTNGLPWCMLADFFPDRPWGADNNPKTAVWEYLKTVPGFEINKSIQNKLLITVAPDGYLKRVS
jgi:hypothetical protein